MDTFYLKKILGRGRSKNVLVITIPWPYLARSSATFIAWRKATSAASHRRVFITSNDAQALPPQSIADRCYPQLFIDSRLRGSGNSRSVQTWEVEPLSADKQKMLHKWTELIVRSAVAALVRSSDNMAVPRICPRSLTVCCSWERTSHLPLLHVYISKSSLRFVCYPSDRSKKKGNDQREPLADIHMSY
jgi:hypothetical protein